MISTPESGIDSIAITYALLDPIMTVARPIAAFFTATFAGVWENLYSDPNKTASPSPDLSCTVDNCCDGLNCPPEDHSRHHSIGDKIRKGLNFALFELWEDMAGWFFLGLLLAGLITAVIPDDLIGKHLGGGIQSMLIMLVCGIPLYICATASTPIAAALILKGLSPGAALVFLIAGPATNLISLTVLLGTLGKRATTIYLISIAFLSVVLGLALDQIYASFDISAKATVGHSAEFMPFWAELMGAILLLVLAIKPIYRSIMKRIRPENAGQPNISIDDGFSKETPDSIPCAGPG